MNTKLTENEKGMLKSVGKYFVALLIMCTSFGKLVGYAMEMGRYSTLIDLEKSV